MEINIVSLDSLGLLKASRVPKEHDWLTDDDKRMIVSVYLCGEGGMARRDAEREQIKNPDVLFRLDANSLAYWEKDKRGNNAYYALTDRGEDLGKLFLMVARNASGKR